MTDTFILAPACAAALAGGLAWARRCRHRVLRRRLRDGVLERAGELHARAMRVQSQAREVLSCLQRIGELPMVEAGAVRSESQEVQMLLTRAGVVSKAAAQLMARCGEEPLPRATLLHALQRESASYERLLAGMEEAVHERQVLLASSRSLLERHDTPGAHPTTARFERPCAS